MKNFDVFNGDADGICALHQMRLAQPRNSELITGVKRDIQLVKNVQAEAGDEVLVLDISLAKNIDAVQGLLNKGCTVQYYDHHLPGDLPEHKNFTATINTSAETCTSLLVNAYLSNQFVLWAIVAAYGDNMTRSADSLAEQQGLDQGQKDQLRDLGIYINYNGYGESLSDLHFEPIRLYRSMQAYADPFDYIKQEPVFEKLKAGYQADMEQAASLTPETQTEKTAVYMLPNQKWCRRISGVLGNQLSNQFPNRAHALLTATDSGCYQVSVRAPQTNKAGAGTLCSQFDTGGGREGAAGINALKAAEKVKFIDAFIKQYS